MCENLYKKQKRIYKIIHMSFAVTETDWKVMALLLVYHFNQFHFTPHVDFNKKNKINLKEKECLVFYN